MSRRTIVTLAAMATLAFAIIAPTASAASSKLNSSVSNGSFSLAYDNNVTVGKNSPNLQFAVQETNVSGGAATCYVHIPELNFSSSPVEILSGATVGFGTAFPDVKHSTLTYEMFCNDVLQVTATSKVTMTDHVG